MAGDLAPGINGIVVNLCKHGGRKIEKFLFDLFKLTFENSDIPLIMKEAYKGGPGAK